MVKKSFSNIKGAVSLTVFLAMLLGIVFIESDTRAVQAVTVENGDFETVGTDTDPIPGFVYDSGCCIGAQVEICADPTSTRSGNVLTVSTGTSYDTSGLHSFRIYQPVSVTPYTDYAWEFYMLPTAGNEQFIGVVAGDTVNRYKNTTVPISATVTEGSLTVSANTFAEGAQADMSGAADSNWKKFGYSGSGWTKIRVDFNSGSNSVVSLAYVARASGRGIYFDDWSILCAVTQIKNGDFETVGTDADPIPGFVYESGSSVGAAVSITADPNGLRSGTVLSVDSGTSYDNSGLHSFRIYQPIYVTPNTDYIWEFYVLPTLNKNHYFGVVAGDTVNSYKNTTVAITAQTVSGTLTLTENTLAQGAQTDMNGAADPNWIHFETQGVDWKKVRVEFNSGSNFVVSLAYVARASERKVLFDDWTIEKKPTSFEFTNGDFEDGLDGFEYESGYLTVTAETDNVYEGVGSARLDTVENSFNQAYFGQSVQVEENTFYEWKFRYRSSTPENRVFVGVLGEDGTTLVGSKLSSDSGFAASEFSLFQDARTTYAKNWHEGLTTETWEEYTVIFYSGENTSVKPTLNLVAKGRIGYTDSWTLQKSTATFE